MTMSADKMDKLYALNQLFGLATGSGQDLVAQIKQAIDFGIEDGAENEAGFQSLTTSAEQLLKLHLQDKANCGFNHCDLRNESDDPLFIRMKVIQSLRILAGAEQAILLISGLRHLVCPDGKRWTTQRKQRYQQLIAQIESLAAKHSSPKTNLRLIFL